ETRAQRADGRTSLRAHVRQAGPHVQNRRLRLRHPERPRHLGRRRSAPLSGDALLGADALRQWRQPRAWRAPYNLSQQRGEAHTKAMDVLGQSGRTAFVGRERELATLQEWLEAARVGRSGVVLIAGEAGIGKTRLLHELTTRAQAAGTQV